MSRLSRFFYNKASLLLAVLFTIVNMGYLYFAMMGHAKSFAVPEGEIFLGTSFGFTYDTVRAFLSARNVESLANYKIFLTVTDTFFPVLYGLQYIFWISYLFKPIGSKTKWLNLFPIVQTVLDWLENFQLVALTNQYLENGIISKSSVQLAAIFSMSKWIVASLVFLIIIVGIGWRAYSFIISKRAVK